MNQVQTGDPGAVAIIISSVEIITLARRFGK